MPDMKLYESISIQYVYEVFLGSGGFNLNVQWRSSLGLTCAEKEEWFICRFLSSRLEKTALLPSTGTAHKKSSDDGGLAHEY